MSNISHGADSGATLRKSKLKAKLWPNGEISIVFHQSKGPSVAQDSAIASLTPLRDAAVRALGVEAALAALGSLGLSHPRNFDKNHPTPARRGLKGITSLGKKRVRNAAYMLTREVGKRRLTFSTVTLPSMEPGELSRVHKAWAECIEFYRREVGRVLRAAGLPGEIVGVSEIQENRYAKTSLPVLHAHFVFVGASRAGRWALSPTQHDYIWRKSIEHVLGYPIGNIPAACQLKSVKINAEAYLGKYMSKGASVVGRVVAQGFGEWLPKQWWNCSRSLVQRMETAIERFESGAGWLVNRGKDPTSDLYRFFKPINVELLNGDVLHVGYFGKLFPNSNNLVRTVLGLT